MNYIVQQIYSTVAWGVHSLDRALNPTLDKIRTYIATGLAMSKETATNGFISAIKSNNLVLAERFCVLGANPNRKDRFGLTPLEWAIKKNNLDLCRLLIKNGADVNSKNRFGLTPFTRAIEKDNLELCRLLIENKADVNAKDRFGRTPLELAIWGENLEFCRLLIENGADVNAKDQVGRAPLDQAIEKKNFDLCLILIEKGAAGWESGRQAYKLLQIGIKANKSDFCELCIRKYADENNTTLLMWSVLFVDFKMFTYLINRNLDIEAKNKGGNSALAFAACLGEIEMCKALIAKGAQVSPEILSAAKSYGNKELVDCLEGRKESSTSLAFERGVDLKRQVDSLLKNKKYDEAMELIRKSRSDSYEEEMDRLKGMLDEKTRKRIQLACRFSNDGKRSLAYQLAAKTQPLAKEDWKHLERQRRLERMLSWAKEVQLVYGDSSYVFFHAQSQPFYPLHHIYKKKAPHERGAFGRNKFLRSVDHLPVSQNIRTYTSSHTVFDHAEETRTSLLSCSASIYSKQQGESALYTLKRNKNFAADANDLIGKATQLPRDDVLSLASSSQSTLGNLVVIAVPKKDMNELVYASHPFGVPCTDAAQKNRLDRLQNDETESICSHGSDQYRIFVPALSKHEGARIFRITPFDRSERKAIKKNIAETLIKAKL